MELCLLGERMQEEGESKEKGGNPSNYFKTSFRIHCLGPTCGTVPGATAGTGTRAGAGAGARAGAGTGVWAVVWVGGRGY